MALGPASDAVQVDVPIYGPFTTAQTAAGAQVVNRSSVASLAFLVWDILITFDDEVRYIWPRKWTYTKYAYFITRYLPLMVQTSILLIGSELTPHFRFKSHDCFIWQVFQGVAAATIITVVDTVLILRIFALYHENRYIRIAVFACFAIEIIGMFTGLALALPGVILDDVCLVIHMPKTLIIYGISSMIFQMFLFMLTIYKFSTQLRADLSLAPLVKLLIRDGTWAFFLLFFVYVGQVILYCLGPHAYLGVLYGWLLTTFSFCGYRILLNLSGLAESTNQIQDATPLNQRTGTNIDFATQILDSNINTMSMPTSMDELSEMELHPRGKNYSRLYPGRQVYNHHQNSRYCSQKSNTIETSEISTFSLGR